VIICAIQTAATSEKYLWCVLWQVADKGTCLSYFTPMFFCQVLRINTAKSVALCNNVISPYILPMYGEKLLAPWQFLKIYNQPMSVAAAVI